MNKRGKLWFYLFLPLSWIYGALVRFNHFIYEAGLRQSISFEIPTLVIGNLRMGGTGKTPLTEWMVRALQRDFVIGVLSRGYKRKTTGYREVKSGDSARQCGDEALQIKRKFPAVTVSVGEDRIMAVPEMLIENAQLQAIILDDAFQHRRLNGGFSILLTEYTNRYTRDYLFPSGWLRDVKSSARRANVILVTKCPVELSHHEKYSIINELKPLALQKVYFTYLQYGTPYSVFNTSERKNWNEMDSVYCLCGIADPAPLLGYLQSKVKQVESRTFPDHFWYSEKDLRLIFSEFRKLQGRSVLLTTEKDSMRLWEFAALFAAEGIDVFCIPVEMKFQENDHLAFYNELISYLQKYQQHDVGFAQPAIK